MFGLSFWEIALILVVALVVLGPKRLPDAARTLGRGLRSLRRASSDIRNAIEEPLREVREPLQEMRDDLYDAVNHFSEEVEESAKIASSDPPPAEIGAPTEDEKSLEEGDERRVASDDPFGGADDEAVREEDRGAALWAASPKVETTKKGSQPAKSEEALPEDEGRG